MEIKQFILILGFVGICIIGRCPAAESNSNREGKQKAQQHKAMKRQVVMELDYLLYLPDDYDKADKKWPLLIFLHGVGERGDDLNLLKKNGPPMLIEKGEEFPFIVVSPQCPADAWWPEKSEHMKMLIDEIIENYNVDENRVYLTGLSMGGYGTWAFACSFPERFAAIAPVCGGGQPYLVKKLKNLPVWAFHGAKDRVVPVERSQEMVNAVKKAGGNAKLTVYPEANHDSWTETYNNDELYEWLLSHSKKQD